MQADVHLDAEKVAQLWRKCCVKSGSETPDIQAVSGSVGAAHQDASAYPSLEAGANNTQSRAPISGRNCNAQAQLVL